jgi:hypothetical protein
VRLERNAGQVVIEDAWDPPASREGTTVVRMLLAGDVRLDGASALVIPLDGATPMRIAWPDDIAATLIERELDDLMLSDVWGARLARLDLDVAHRDGVVVTVELDEAIAEDAR